MVTILHNTPVHRTALMTLSAAIAVCFKMRNDPRYADPSSIRVVLSSRSQDDSRKWYVRREMSEAEAALALQHAQRVRHRRALDEAPDYDWRFEADHSAAHVLTPQGAVYTIGGIQSGNPTCTCADFTHVCSRNGLACKHLVAYHLLEGSTVDEETGKIDHAAFEESNPDINAEELAYQHDLDTVPAAEYAAA